MRIAVIGPGAMGCLLAALLSKGGHEVWLVDRRPERARVLDRRGVLVSEAGDEGRDTRLRVPVHATADPGRVGEVELVIVAVKSRDTAEAGSAAGRMAGLKTSILTLQNGLGNLETLQDALGGDRVLAGVTSQGATSIGPGEVIHAGSGPTVVGEASGEASARARTIAEIFSAAGIPTEVTDDIESARWGKLVVNAGLNAVAALARVPNGALVTSENLQSAMREAVQEAVRVAEAKGITLPEEDMAAWSKEICRRTDKNINSMLQDLLRGRPTEIDAINGAVVREGRALGVPTPVNQLLAWLVRGIEETSDRRVPPPGSAGRKATAA